jgi:hypothetical protein
LKACKRAYGALGWIVPELLEAAASATSLYFDEVAQVVMPRWSTGRVVLTGDACQCVSLLAGQGASMAVAEAYVLAEELSDRAAHDTPAALARYEERLKPELVERGVAREIREHADRSMYEERCEPTAVDRVHRDLPVRHREGAEAVERARAPGGGPPRRGPPPGGRPGGGRPGGAAQGGAAQGGRRRVQARGDADEQETLEKSASPRQLDLVRTSQYALFMRPAVDRTRTGFYRDEEFERAVGNFYGQYIITFESENHQVHAHLFEENGLLVAHLTFAPAYDGGRATDHYLSPLKEFARGKGFEGKFRLVYS